MRSRLLVLFVTVLCCARGFGADAHPALDVLCRDAGVTGGILVLMGSGESGALATFARDGRFLVRVFDADQDRVNRARRFLQAQNAYGRVSVAHLSDGTLPLRSNLVNILIAPEDMGIPEAEFLRVLRPGGVLVRGIGPDRTTRRKPDAANTDDWTHFLYDASNNAVSKDRVVGPVDTLQWVDNPRWSRSHDYLSSFTTGVSQGGRLFYIADTAPSASILLPPQWRLVCRDGYNGMPLWSRDIPEWFDQLHWFRSGPNYLLRRLVAVEGRIAVTLGWQAPVSILDAVSGKTLLTLSGSERTEEILWRDDTIYVVINNEMADDAARYYRRHAPRDALPPEVPRHGKAIAAYAAGTGELRWRVEDTVQEMTLAADGGQVCYLGADSVVCRNAEDGSLTWRVDRPSVQRRPNWSVPTLVLYKDVVFVGDRGRTIGNDTDITMRDLNDGGVSGVLTAYSRLDGRRLWECPAEDGFHTPVEIFVMRDRVWTGSIADKDRPGFTRARDYRTGEVVFQRPPDQDFRDFNAGHNRCYRNKATEKYIITGRSYIEWMDVQSGTLVSNIFTRGTCSFGVLPANGLLYVPVSSCMCAWDRKLNGMMALAGSATPGTPPRWPTPSPERPHLAAHKSPVVTAEDWPTYRHDPRRSGVTPLTLQLPLEQAWRSPVRGTPLTAPTAAWGGIYVASPGSHAVECLDAATGELRWRVTVDGPVDSPPTLYQGTACFGSRDGVLHAVDAQSGETVWRLRLAPRRELIPAFGSLESPWPVSGAVLLKDDFFYAVAGRSPFLDGGLCLFKVDAATGEVVRKRPLMGVVKRRGEDNSLLPDLLSAGGEGFYMGRNGFRYDTLEPLKNTEKHLWSPTGFLDDNWMHRTYWLYGRDYGRTWTLNEPEMPVAAGRLMCIDRAAKLAFSFGRNRFEWMVLPKNWRSGEKRYQVRATALTDSVSNTLAGPEAANIRRGTALARHAVWAAESTIEARAMAVTREHILLAGPVGDVMDNLAAFRGEAGVELHVLDRATGALVQSLPIPAMPAFDGLMVANGRVYMALRDGSVLCFRASAR